MAALSVTQLRTLAREAMISCGARGFMRFDERGGALLVTDAGARCADGGEALAAALTAAGFDCRRDGALTYLVPGDALLERLCEGEGPVVCDWSSLLYPVLALAGRLVRTPCCALTQDGRALVLLAAQLCRRAETDGAGAFDPLRAELAQRLRRKDQNGFNQTGRLLANWCSGVGKEERA